MAQKKKSVSKPEANHSPKSTPLSKPWPNSVGWGFVIVGLLFFAWGLFSNISKPLFWADESMTVVGGQRVLSFGYPKVHDGKNVFYDLRHSNPTLGIDEKTDAFIGGSNWGHYYLAALGVTLANGSDDVYTKTGIIRTVFALFGMLGLVLIGYLGFKSSPTPTIGFLLVFGLLVLSGLSVPLLLHLREARYYPMVLGWTAFCLFWIVSRQNGWLKNGILYIIGLTVGLFCYFITFTPGFFIFYVAFGVYFGVKTIFSISWDKEKMDKEWIITQAITILPFVLVLIGILPLLGYFKTFEINKALAEFNGYNDKMYWDNVTNVWKYLTSNSIFYLTLVLAAGTGIRVKHIWQQQELKPLLSLGVFLMAFALAYLFFIGRVPNYLFTRYFIILEPLVFATSMVLASVIILHFIKNNLSLAQNLTLVAILVFAGIVFAKNASLWGKKMYENSHAYQGTLDAVIPYIKDKYKNTEQLVIATNYEETSYMYYLGSKVTIGFVGNNLEADKKVLPDIIQYRKSWGTDPSVFSSFLQQSQYERIVLPVRDNFTNNNPELFFPNPMLNHQFKTLMPQGEQDAVELYLKKPTN